MTTADKKLLDKVKELYESQYRETMSAWGEEDTPSKRVAFYRAALTGLKQQPLSKPWVQTKMLDYLYNRQVYYEKQVVEQIRDLVEGDRDESSQTPYDWRMRHRWSHSERYLRSRGDGNGEGNDPTQQIQ